MSWNMERWITEDTVTVAPITYPGATQYHDARSAAFYALGIALKKNVPVTLIIPGQYLSNTYTAITEAWFQKANIIVIALFEKVSEVKTFWMDRCVLQSATFGHDEQTSFEKMLKSARGLPGPVLFNLIGYSQQEEVIDYTAVITALLSLCPPLKITAYHPNNPQNENITAVPRENKYGLISKYIGMSTLKDTGVLLCPAECALLDMNVFRTRYANSNMKIVLLDEKGLLDDLNIPQWITENGWLYFATDGAEMSGAEWLLSQQQQAVWMIR